MERRSFLRLLGIGVAAAAVPSAALATLETAAGVAKKYFLPPDGGWKPKVLTGNAFVTPEWSARNFASAWDRNGALSIRYLKEYVIAADQLPERFDVLYGEATLIRDLQFERSIRVAAKRLADKIDADIAERYMKTFNYATTSGNGFVPPRAPWELLP